MKRAIVLWLLCSPSAWAQVYKCNGIYQDIPCQTGQEVAIDENYKPDPNNPVILPQANLLNESRIRSARDSSQIVVGMTAQDVRYAWGTPTHINPSFSVDVIREQWVYRRDNGNSQYIYLENGKVTSWN
ncbi:hypothetical protein D3C85_929520 [compost metagenome]